jgi:hypothetical protein
MKQNKKIFMHEYGHTVDSRLFGVSYLFAIGVPSAISAGNSKTVPKSAIFYS